jgi:hypothetical protein
LERENKNLISENNNNNLKSRDLLFKKIELENEVKNYMGLNEKLKSELDNKNKEYETVLNKNKSLVKSYSNKINNLVLMISKLKKKYLSDIFILKNQINNITQIFQSNYMQTGFELKENLKYVKNGINQLYKDNLSKEENIRKLKQELKIKDNDNYNLKDALNKLKLSYKETIKKSGISEKILNGKVEKEKIRIEDNINQNENK